MITLFNKRMMKSVPSVSILFTLKLKEKNYNFIFVHRKDKN